MSRLLALDASTDTIHLALVSGDEVRTAAVPGGARSSQALLPAIQAMLSDAGWGLSDLDAIGFGRGPGAFTGLRTACAVAQGLALGCGVPLLPLDTLALVAESAHRQGAGDSVWTAVDARMNEIYASRWNRRASGGWQAVEPVRLWSPQDLVTTLCTPSEADVPVVGNALKVFAELSQGVVGRSWPEAVPDGASLHALVRQAWRDGPRLDPALALPLYVRDKVAQTTAERLALKQGAAAVSPGIPT